MARDVLEGSASGVIQRTTQECEKWLSVLEKTGANCVPASEESDADKLLSLVHEILHAFEENDPTPMLPGRPNALATKP